MYLATHGNWVGLTRDSAVGTGGTHFLTCQCSKLRTRKASLTWMHKDEEMFNLCVPAIDSHLYVTVFSSKGF